MRKLNPSRWWCGCLWAWSLAATSWGQTVLPSPVVDEGWRPLSAPAPLRTADARLGSEDYVPPLPGVSVLQGGSTAAGSSAAPTAVESTAQRPWGGWSSQAQYSQPPATTVPADLPPTLNVPDAAPLNGAPVGAGVAPAPYASGGPVYPPPTAAGYGGDCRGSPNYVYAPGQASNPYAAQASFYYPAPQPVTPAAGPFRGVYQDAPAMATPQAVAPPGYYLGRTLLGSPKLYGVRQPLRNAIRFVTP